MNSENFSGILSIAAAITFILFLVGLFNPQKALFWYKGERNRKKSALIYLLAFFFFAYLKPNTNPHKSNDNVAENSKLAEEKKVVTKTSLNLSPEELILSEKELDNAKLDKKWSATVSNGLSNSYRKKLDGYTERAIKLELYKFDDSTAANSKYLEDMDSFFSKTRDNGNGGREKNPFYSKRINIEKIGDKSFCYNFVSPTVEVLFKNYIISCDVTKDYPYENISENNAATLKKSIDIIKQQIEKIKTKNQL